MGSSIESRDLFLFFVMGSPLDSGLDARVKGFEKIRCSMIWDGISCVKGLERMKCSIV